MMIVYAVNVHVGGGKVLLDELLQTQQFGQISCAFIDERYSPPVTAKNIRFVRIKPSIWSRVLAEFHLKSLISKAKTFSEPILFFGNLPPIIKHNNPSIVYLQNCFLIPPVPLPKDTFKVLIRTAIERLWLRLFARNISELWVQTKWMVQIAGTRFPHLNIQLKPFLPSLPKKSNSAPKHYSFCYIGGLSQNKNLSLLLRALAILDPTINQDLAIAIVLDAQISNKFPDLKHIKIKWHYNLNREEIFDVLLASKALIITSHYESFALPMYEARHFGLEVICPNSGYAENCPFPVTVFKQNEPESLCTIMNNFLIRP